MDIDTLMNRPAWMADANCKGMTDLFFNADGDGKAHTARAAEARAVCRACDVQAECLAYALNNGETFGIWGGFSARSRARLRAGGPRRNAAQCGTNSGHDRHRRLGEEPCEACRDAHNAYKRDHHARARSVVA